MGVYRVTKQGEGFEVYEVEADSVEDAVMRTQSEWPVDTRVESAELLSIEEIES